MLDRQMRSLIDARVSGLPCRWTCGLLFPSSRELRTRMQRSFDALIEATRERDEHELHEHGAWIPTGAVVTVRHRTRINGNMP